MAETRPRAVVSALPGWMRWGGGVLAALVAAFAVCEALGWPFLGGPLQRAMGSALKREIALSEGGGQDGSLRVHLLGGIRLSAPYIRIGAPAWSHEPHMLLARGASMTLGYLDLWRARGGAPLRIRELKADLLDGRIERLADGRASWQFGTKTDVPDADKQPTRLPIFGRLQVKDGSLTYRDATIDADLAATMSLVDGTNVSPGGIQGSATGLVFAGTGHYRKQPVKIGLHGSNVLSAAGGDTNAKLPVTLEATIGGASVSFEGTATDVLHLTALAGRYSVKGSSLAAVGDPLRVTLPSTPPFAAEGRLAKDGDVWNVVVDSATIGSSRLGGAFRYDPQPARPLLSGRVTGSRLLLADLGPSVGARTGKGTADAAPTEKDEKKAGGRVLPDRAFDLPSLRAMDANILVDIGDLDLGSTILEPFEPLRAHIVLADGVLTVGEIDARTGQGRLDGSLRLDGRGEIALWQADLRLAGVRLESFIHQKRGGDAPPYLTGRLNAQTRLAGQGRSTAAILGSLAGEMRLQVVDGTVSHLVVEAAGLDVAQGLGMLFKGDDALRLSCSVADFGVAGGVMTPKVAVLDTSDSTILITGSISLASEALDLRLVTQPRDFSPLALRAPVLLHGTLGAPRVALEAGRLGGKVGVAAVLATIVAPIAAVIPLLDFGDKEEAQKGAAACRALSKRMARQPIPTPATPLTPPTSTSPAVRSGRPNA